MGGPEFNIIKSDHTGRPNLEIKLDESIYATKGQEIKTLIIPLRSEGLSRLRSEIMRHDLAALAESPMLLTPTPPSGDYVKLLEERLAKAEERVDRLIAALVDPA